MAVGRTYLFPPLSSGGALLVRPWLRFHIPLIEPDMRISRIRLSDKTSRLHPRRVAPKPAQAYEPEVPVEVREWIGPAPASPDLVLEAQPPAQPHRCVVVERPIRYDDGADTEVVGPSDQRAVQSPTSFVVSCQVRARSVSAWTLSTMRLMLFFDGRRPSGPCPSLESTFART